MTLHSEMYRLIDLMPASGRMYVKLIDNRTQPEVITAQVPRPWNEARLISINFDLWEKLPQAQRDLLLLRTVSWAIDFKWVKPSLYQGIMGAGVIGMLLEMLRFDAAGMVTAVVVTGAAGMQVIRQSRSSAAELDADEKGIQVATRRGYTETEATQHLLAAIAAVAQLEGRSTLNFVEQIRSQTLKTLAGLSPIAHPSP